MKQFKAYTGQAGTGKTTKLIESVVEFVKQNELEEYQSILALTFMHGSRKRLKNRLEPIKQDMGVNYQCSTIDSFIVSLVNKFRSYLNIRKTIFVNTEDESTIDLNEDETLIPLNSIQLKGIELLKMQSVKDYISNSYPLIIIDEFQDCEGNLLDFVKELSKITSLFVALDSFQNLNNQQSTSAEDWLQNTDCESIDLNNKIWRTNKQNLLNTSISLRTGSNVNKSMIKVMACPSPYQAGALIKTNIYFWHKPKQTFAIISPVSPAKSKYVNIAISNLSTPHTIKKGNHKGKVIGPYNYLLSKSSKTDIKKICPELLNVGFKNSDYENLLAHESYIVKQGAQLAYKKNKLRNQNKMSAIEFNSILRQFAHIYDNFIIREIKSGILYTSIHGAKNREFDSIIVLWPYEVAGNILYKRKLLYNAITRAKKHAVVLVQNKKAEIESLKDDDLFSLIL